MEAVFQLDVVPFQRYVSVSGKVDTTIGDKMIASETLDVALPQVPETTQ